MIDLIKGKHVSIYNETKYKYITDNILYYYDIEEYDNTCVYVMLEEHNYDIIDKFDKIILYNVEHVIVYGKMFLSNYYPFIKEILKNNKLLEFWDFDIINYRMICYYVPEALTHYKFMPFRYVPRKCVDEGEKKKYELLQIGVTRYQSPFRDKVLQQIITLIRNNNLNFSLKEIEVSNYTMEELFDEINSSKYVLNVPRLQSGCQEQVRLGELISMNCNIVSFNAGLYTVSYLTDYINDINVNKSGGVTREDLDNLKLINGVAEKFKKSTLLQDDYIKYTNSCYEKWYSNSTDSFILSVCITACDKSMLEKTILNLQDNNIYSRIQIFINDLSSDDEIKSYYENNLDHFQFYYIKSNNKYDAYNTNIKCAVGKYIMFIDSGDVYMSGYLDNVTERMNTPDFEIYYDFFVTCYTQNNIVYNLAFDEVDIGPILQCCVFKRNAIDYYFDTTVYSADIIFTGVLRKQHPYYFNLKDGQIDKYNYAYIMPEIQFVYEEDPFEDQYEWLDYVKTKIDEACAGANSHNA